VQPWPAVVAAKVRPAGQAVAPPGDRGRRRSAAWPRGCASSSGGRLEGGPSTAGAGRLRDEASSRTAPEQARDAATAAACRIPIGRGAPKTTLTITAARGCPCPRSRR